MSTKSQNKTKIKSSSTKQKVKKSNPIDIETRSDVKKKCYIDSEPILDPTKVESKPVIEKQNQFSIESVQNKKEEFNKYIEELTYTKESIAGYQDNISENKTKLTLWQKIILFFKSLF